jgi:CubicO group peptidase (beta-lactamase class C family)
MMPKYKKKHPEKSKPWSPNAPAAESLRFSDLARVNPGDGRPIDRGYVRLTSGESAYEAFDGELQFELAGIRPDRPTVRPGVNLTGGPSFSVRRFADELRRRLDGNAVGWAFVINQNGQEAAADADGTAITPGDLDRDGDVIGTRDFTPDTRINVASVSKTITAVAVLRLLGALGLGIETPIAPFLPDGWFQGRDVDRLRFRHLLTHFSGLRSTNDNFGITLPDTGLRATLLNGALRARRMPIST